LFYECFYRRSDALFELADAILTVDRAAPSPAHLSLQASHRRGLGSPYAALDRGRIDDEASRKLLARYPLASAEGEPSVYAVLTRACGIAATPRRVPYSRLLLPSVPPLRRPAHRRRVSLPNRRTTGLRPRGLDRPLDVERVRPAQDANVVAAEQVEAFLVRLEEGVVPCSSSTRATTLSSSSEGSREARARSSSVCERGGASTATRASRIRPHTSDALVATGRR
jgi:hypothetical protein